MRARDYIGFPLLVIGIPVTMLGHHWFGVICMFAGIALTAIGIFIISSGGLQDRLEEALRSHRGPGDYGDRHYHGGPEEFHSGDSGADHGGTGDGGGDGH